MPKARRLVPLTAAMSLLLPVLAAAASGPVTIDQHDSFISTAAYEISSDTGGTVYSADVGGFGHLYLAPAPMTVGSTTVDLGPRPYARLGATIVGSRVAFPNAPTFDPSNYSNPVTSVLSCVAGTTCPATTAVTFPAGWAYVGNGNDVAVVFNLTTNKLGLASWTTGAVSTQYAMPTAHDEVPEVSADANGIVVSGGGDITFVNRSTAAVTDLDYGNRGVVTPLYVVWYAVGVGPSFDRTRIYRALRSSPTTVTTVADLAGAPDFDDLVASDGGAAWTISNDDGTNQLWSTVYDGVRAQYSRSLENSGVAMFQGTNQVLIDDRAAGIPGFYKVDLGAYSGTLTGLLPVRPSITHALAVSNGRAVYSDDTTEWIPAYLRDVEGGALGPESSVATAADGTVALSGPYIAYTTTSSTPGYHDVWYGAVGGPVARRTYADPDAVVAKLSGRRVLLTGGTTSRVIDITTGAVTDLGHTRAAIFGEYVALLNYDTGALTLRNLVTGATGTLRGAVAGCTTSCIDEEGWHLSVWGREVVWAFGYGGTTPGFATGWYNGSTTTSPLPMLLNGAEGDVYDLVYWDGLLLTARAHDFTVHLYSMRGGPAVDTQLATFAEPPLGLDGTVAAWRPDADLRAVVRPVTDVYPSYAPEPRWLGGALPGGLAPGTATPTWDPSFLLSNDTSGTVDIHSGSVTGPVVRSLPYESSHGEASVSWDGKDGASADVPAGTYWWTLSRAAAAPTNVKNAGGTADASGTVFVSRTALAAPTLTVPALASDTSATPTFTISWVRPAGAPAGTKYLVQRAANGGAFGTFTTTTATSVAFPGAAGNTYRFRVQAIDPGGRAGAFSATGTTVDPWDDASASFSASWFLGTTGSRFRASEHVTDTAGATMVFTATGSTIWLVGTKAANYGQFYVSVDGGAYAGPYDSYSATTRYRQVLYARGGLALGSHTVRVKTVGTSGRPRVGIDAMGFRR